MNFPCVCVCVLILLAFAAAYELTISMRQVACVFYVCMCFVYEVSFSFFPRMPVSLFRCYFLLFSFS